MALSLLERRNLRRDLCAYLRQAGMGLGCGLRNHHGMLHAWFVSILPAGYQQNRLYLNQHDRSLGLRGNLGCACAEVSQVLGGERMRRSHCWLLLLIVCLVAMPPLAF